MNIDIYVICKDFPSIDKPIAFQMIYEDKSTGVVYEGERFIYDPKKAVRHEQTKPFFE